jgi:hypothetical protein
MSSDFSSPHFKNKTMRIYRVEVSGDKYPSEYIIQASNWAAAISRAVREWQKAKGKGSRTEMVKIKAIKGGSLLKENEI